MRGSTQLSPLTLLGIAIIIIGLASVVYTITQNTDFRQHAAEGATLYLSSDPPTAKKGEKVNLSIAVETNTVPIETVTVKLAYPENKLSLESIDTSRSRFDMHGERISGNGVIILSRDASSPVNGRNHIATVHFTAKSDVDLNSIQPLTGTAIFDTEDKNIFSNAVATESAKESRSIFTIQFFFKFFQNFFQK